MTKIRTTIEKITPTKAEQYLEGNTTNRRLRRGVVNRYAAQIKAGQWGLTGEPIIFDSRGSLLNGQHRLKGCIEAGKPFQTTVIRGIAPDMFAKMDSGILRSAGDALQIAGHKYYTSQAAGAKAVLKLRFAEEHGYWPIGRHLYLSSQDVLDFVGTNPDLVECVYAIFVTWKKPFLLPVSVFSGLYYYLYTINSARADEFFEALATGEGLSRNSPIMKLRDVLISDASAKLKHKASWKAAVTIKAWNLWLAGKTVSRTLQYRSDEAWPIPARRRAKGA